jgi:hypothetical protein
MSRKKATQTTDIDAPSAKTLSRQLDTESFMEASLPVSQSCFGELSGDGIA